MSVLFAESNKTKICKYFKLFEFANRGIDEGITIALANFEHIVKSNLPF